MNPVPCLGRQGVEPESPLPEEIPRKLHLRPGHLDVPDRAFVPVLRLGAQAVVIGTDVRIARNDHVGQIGRRFRALAVDDEVLAVFDRLRNIRVGVKPPRIGVEGLVLVDLFPERDARSLVDSSRQRQQSSQFQSLPLQLAVPLPLAILALKSPTVRGPSMRITRPTYQ